jgi:carbon storage regulator CsrA
MLVLSRRAKERIVFPHLQISVEVLRIAGNAVRLGVEAPDDVTVLRGELEVTPASLEARKPAASKAAAPKTVIAAEFAQREHRIRNRLQTALLRIHLLSRQLAVGAAAPEQVGAGLRDALAELEALDAAFGELFAAASGTAQPPNAPQPAPRAANPPANKCAPLARRMSAMKQSTASPHGALNGGASPRVHALLVEDNANESSLLASYLEQRGIDVITAADGADALDVLSSRPEPPDVVLLDMLMPRCDGPSTVKAIRCNPGFQGVRIYAVSGTSPNSLGVPTGPSGVDAWFQKPLNPERLVQEMVSSLVFGEEAKRDPCVAADIGGFI